MAGKKRNCPSLPFLPRIIAFLGYIPWYRQPRNLGEKISRTRKWLGITQEELAREIGIDPATLPKWEKGRGRPSEKSMERLKTHYLRCPKGYLVNHLISGKGYRKARVCHFDPTGGDQRRADKCIKLVTGQWEWFWTETIGKEDQIANLRE